MDWQVMVVAAVVLGAAGFLARRAYLAYRRPDCGDGCSTCSAKGAQKPPELVRLRLHKNDHQ